MLSAASARWYGDLRAEVRVLREARTGREAHLLAAELQPVLRSEPLRFLSEKMETIIFLLLLLRKLVLKLMMHHLLLLILKLRILVNYKKLYSKQM